MPVTAPVQAPLPTQQHHSSDDDTWTPNSEVQSAQTHIIREGNKGAHILELVSPPHAYHPSLAGKTSLLHLIVTHAILPSSISGVSLAGKNATIILFDPLHHFSVPFLTKTILSHITASFHAAGRDSNEVELRREIRECIKRALDHLHIFRPTSWESLLATLRSLEAYLFDPTRHRSMHRVVHSIVLEDIDAFVPALRNEMTQVDGGNALRSPSARLTHELEKLTGRLSCAVVTTSRSVTPGTYRPAVPAAWPTGMQLTRLAVRRVEVLKFAPAISVEQAEGERTQRWKVVQRGRFEAWRVGQGRNGEGFVYRVGDGVMVEREGGR